jgi:hypothetical protein
MRVRTTRITVERDTTMVIRRAGSERSWCALCATEVDVVSLYGEVLTEILAQGIAHGWIAAGQLHVIDRPSEPTRICLASLLRCFEPQLNIPKETL